MSAPEGLGMWIAFWKNADRGDIRNIIPRCHRSGISWLAIRCNSGNERANFKFVAPQLQDEGIAVYSWKYTTMKDLDVQTAIIQECFDDGAEGHIINPEVEWEQDNSSLEAFNWLSKVREKLPDSYIAYAPMDCPGFHPKFPYSTFNSFCDAAMPQTYWTEHDDKGAEATLGRAERQWAALKVPAKEYLPIGVTYGRGTPYASNERSGKMGLFKMKDLDNFLNRYPGKAISLYSYEASFQTTWDLLERYHNVGELAKGGVFNRLKGM